MAENTSQPPPSEDPTKEPFDLNEIANAVDESQTPQPEETEVDKDKPVYHKDVREQPQPNTFNITLRQIRENIKAAFKKSQAKPVTSKVHQPTPAQEKQQEASKDVSATVVQDKTQARVWTAKVKQNIAADIYDKIKATATTSTASQEPVSEEAQAAVQPIAATQQVVSALRTQQQLSVEQYVREKADSLVRDKVQISGRQKTNTILSQILAINIRHQDFFEGTFQKYLMTNIELKFKHLLVSRESLEYTKRMVFSLEDKLESIIHNTSLSEVSKIGFFGELKRSMRLGVNKFLTDTIIKQFKSPIEEFVQKNADKLKEKLKIKVSETKEKIEQHPEFQKRKKQVVEKYEDLKTKAEEQRDKLKEKIKEQRENFKKRFRSTETTDEETPDVTEEVSSDVSSEPEEVQQQVRRRLRRFTQRIRPQNLPRISPFFQNPQQSQITRSFVERFKQQHTEPDQIEYRPEVPASEDIIDMVPEPSTIQQRIEDTITTFADTVTEATDQIRERITVPKSIRSLKDRIRDAKKPQVLQDISDTVTKRVSELHDYITQPESEPLKDLQQKASEHIASLRIKATEHIDPLKEKLTQRASEFKSSLPKHVDQLKEKFASIAPPSRYNYLKVLAERVKVVYTPNEETEHLPQVQQQQSRSEQPVEQQIPQTEPTSPEQKKISIKERITEFKNKAVDTISEYKNQLEEHVSSDEFKDKQQELRDSFLKNKDALKQTLSEQTATLRTLIEERLQDFSLRKIADEYQRKAQQTIQRIAPSETPSEPTEKQEDPIVIRLDTIIDLLKQQSATADSFDESKIDIANQSFMQLGLIRNQIAASAQGGDQDLQQSAGLWARIPGIEKRGSGSLVKGIRKGAGLYLKGVGKFYSGLFQLTRKTISKLPKPTPEGVGNLVKGGMNLAGKGLNMYASLLGKILGFEAKTMIGMTKGIFNLGKTLFTEKNLFVDVYRKDEVELGKPLLKGFRIKDQECIYQDGSPVEDSYSIKEPVYDKKTEQVLITEEDIRHGLVDSNNKALTKSVFQGLGIKSIKGMGKAAGFLIKKQFQLAKKVYGTTFDILKDIVTGIPKLGSTLFPNSIDKKTVQEHIENHLIKIAKLITPISAHFDPKGVREGSYDDYKRDREAEQQKPKRERARDLSPKGQVTKTLGKGLGKMAAMGAGGALLSKALGIPGNDEDNEKESEGSGIIDTATNTVVGGYLLNKAKSLFTKKGTEAAAKKAATEGIKQTAKRSMLRSGVTALGRFGIMQAARTAVISLGTAAASAASAPAVLTGLAVAGMGAGGYAIWNWSEGKDRIRIITKIRNAVYRVPEDKINTLIRFENTIAEKLDKGGTETLKMNALEEFIEDFGLDPKNKKHVMFYRFWYATVFFPIFKASYDLFRGHFKVSFADQAKLKDDELNQYKQALEDTSTYNELKAIPVELSPLGFKQWINSPHSKGFKEINSDSYKQAAADRIKMTESLLNPEKKKEAIRNNAFQKQNQEVADEIADNYGDVSPYALFNVPTKQKELVKDELSKPGVMGHADFGGLKSIQKAKETIDEASEDSGSTPATGNELGDAVSKYESGKSGVATVSSGKGDPGGASYGKYQLASKTGTLQRYLKSSGYAKEFEGLSPGTPPFNSKWRELAAKDENFGKTQKEFIKKTHFDPAIKEAERLGFDVTDKGVQEMVWSGSIQHGKINKVLGLAAAVPGFAQMSLEDKIKAFYKVRSEYAANAMRSNGADPGVIYNASFGRYQKEVKDVLKLAGKSVEQPPQPGTPPPIVASSGPTQDAPVEPQPATAPSPQAPTASVPAEPTVAQAPQPTQPTPQAPSIPQELPPPPPQTQQEKIAQSVNSAANYQIQRMISGEAQKSEEAYLAKKAARKAAEAAQQSTPVQTDITKPTASTTPFIYQNRESVSPISRDYIQKRFEQTEPATDQYAMTPMLPQPTMPATRNVMNAVEKNAEIASAGQQEITVVDPEAKTHTSLLSEQNRILAQIASILTKTPSSEKGMPQSNEAILKKLDGVIGAIQHSGTTAEKVQQANEQNIPHLAKADMRVVRSTERQGIDVSRIRVS